MILKAIAWIENVASQALAPPWTAPSAWVSGGRSSLGFTSATTSRQALPCGNETLSSRPFPSRPRENRRGAHLDRLFLAQVGRTLKQHADQRKRNAAEETLSIPGIRVKEVAASLGFVSPASFHCWFRRFHPMSPREFQKSHAPAVTTRTPIPNMPTRFPQAGESAPAVLSKAGVFR